MNKLFLFFMIISFSNSAFAKGRTPSSVVSSELFKGAKVCAIEMEGNVKASCDGASAITMYSDSAILLSNVSGTLKYFKEIGFDILNCVNSGKDANLICIVKRR